MGNVRCICYNTPFMQEQFCGPSLRPLTLGTATRACATRTYVGPDIWQHEMPHAFPMQLNYPPCLDTFLCVFIVCPLPSRRAIDWCVCCNKQQANVQWFMCACSHVGKYVWNSKMSQNSPGTCSVCSIRYTAAPEEWILRETMPRMHPRQPITNRLEGKIAPEAV
jgi:hypothetical protein